MVKAKESSFIIFQQNKPFQKNSVPPFCPMSGPAEAVQPLRPLVEPKILPSAVKVLYFQNFGRTNNCLVKVFLKWSDQSCTPSATPACHRKTNCLRQQKGKNDREMQGFLPQSKIPFT